MLKHLCAIPMAMMLFVSQSKSQPMPNIEGMAVDQQLFGICMASRRNERFCNCMFEVSNKNIKGPKFKKIWYAYQAYPTPAEANRLRGELTPAESQIINGQLQAADAAQGACNARFGIR